MAALKAAIERWEAGLLPADSDVSEGEQADVESAVDAECIETLLREAGGAGLDEFVSIFAEESPRMLGAIRNAVEAGDSKALRCAAHELKGACGNFGAARLYKLCGTMEEQGKSGEIGATDVLFDSVKREHGRVLAVLEQLSLEGAKV
jgi:HPt (histidine-containing phosphotransfer) domain-containing protein